MIELPEALTIARQIDETLVGKRVAHADQGNSPHKFAWYTKSSEEYYRTLTGQRVTGATGFGNRISIHLDGGWDLVPGDMGGRVLFHPDESSLPAKRHLLVGFDDGSFLTVAIQGWGGMFLWDGAEAARRAAEAGIDPLGDELTLERLQELLDT
jgi:formamidopyrimidine-DNA glycosylase